jgi:hypothetical protein
LQQPQGCSSITETALVAKPSFPVWNRG